VNLITLTTDFGLNDWFAGTMHGVVLGINPAATVVHLTHGVPRGDVRAGAFALAASCRFFPKGAIHVVVVDPGVGGARKAIAVETGDYFFVGPDNGVLSWALLKETIKAIHTLENPEFFVKPVSATFHGRDIFAPVAAHLSRGVPIQAFGPRLEDWVPLPWAEPRVSANEAEGEVVYIDRFGNAITTLGAESLKSMPAGALTVSAGAGGQIPVSGCYSAVGPGQAVAVLGSSGLLEIALNGGSAAQVLGLKIGSPVRAIHGQ
jgi:S-adenosyl-L-methionine hydrolase (adenosine-forming)